MSHARPSSPEKLSDDLLIGAAAIAGFLYGTPEARRKVYHLASTTQAPMRKLGPVWWLSARS